MPSARSRESAPVGIDSIAMWTFSPIRMIEPLPNCFSICPRATPSAFSRSSAIALSPRVVCALSNWTLRVGCVIRPRAARTDLRIVLRTPVREEGCPASFDPEYPSFLCEDVGARMGIEGPTDGGSSQRRHVSSPAATSASRVASTWPRRARRGPKVGGERRGPDLGDYHRRRRRPGHKGVRAEPGLERPDGQLRAQPPGKVGHVRQPGQHLTAHRDPAVELPSRLDATSATALRPTQCGARIGSQALGCRLAARQVERRSKRRPRGVPRKARARLGVEGVGDGEAVVGVALVIAQALGEQRPRGAPRGSSGAASPRRSARCGRTPPGTRRRSRGPLGRGAPRPRPLEQVAEPASRRHAVGGLTTTLRPAPRRRTPAQMLSRPVRGEDDALQSTITAWSNGGAIGLAVVVDQVASQQVEGRDGRVLADPWPVTGRWNSRTKVAPLAGATPRTRCRPAGRPAPRVRRPR